MKAGCSRPLPSLSPCLASTDTTVSVLPACGSSPMLFLSPFGGVRHERFQYPIRASKCSPCQASSCALAPGCTTSEKGGSGVRRNRRRSISFRFPVRRSYRARGFGEIRGPRADDLKMVRWCAQRLLGAHAVSTLVVVSLAWLGQERLGPAATLCCASTDFGICKSAAWKYPKSFAVRTSSPLAELRDARWTWRLPRWLRMNRAAIEGRATASA
jgi:hypothetical protein